MSAPPYMTVYIAEWTADVQGLSCEQDGAYWRLVRALWRAGGKLPNKPEKLAMICGLSLRRWQEIGPDVIALFIIRGGSLTHKRVTKERRKYDAKILKSRGAAKASHSEKSKRNKQKSSADAANPQLRKPCQQEPEPEKGNDVLTGQIITLPRAEPRLLPEGSSLGALDDEQSSWPHKPLPREELRKLAVGLVDELRGKRP